MPMLRNEHEQEASNQQAAELTKRLGDKREAIEAALNNAPHGRHAQERTSLDAARERFAAMAAKGESKQVDAFFAEQKQRLERLQEAELRLGERALHERPADDPAQALRNLEQAVEQIGQLHRAEHNRMDAERAQLAKGLTTTDEARRSARLDEARKTQETNAATQKAELDEAARVQTAQADTRLAGERRDNQLAGQAPEITSVPWSAKERAFAEMPGEAWSAQERDERLARGTGQDRLVGWSAENMRAARRTEEELDVASRLARGNFGERAAAEAAELFSRSRPGQA